MTEKATAYHEAGHAVMCVNQGVALQEASIVPQKGYAGSTIHNNPMVGRPLDIEVTARDRWRMEKLIRIYLAGDVAQRKFNPKSVRNHHASDDYSKAVDLMDFFCGSNDEVEAYINLLHVQTKQIITSSMVWPQVRAVADELLKVHTIRGSRVREIRLQQIEAL